MALGESRREEHRKKGESWRGRMEVEMGTAERERGREEGGFRLMVEFDKKSRQSCLFFPPSLFAS